MGWKKTIVLRPLSIVALGVNLVASPGRAEESTDKPAPSDWIARIDFETGDYTQTDGTERHSHKVVLDYQGRTWWNN